MERLIWKDEIIERPRTYMPTNNPDGTITLVPEKGEVFQEGTLINAMNLNRLGQEYDSFRDGVTGDITQFKQNIAGDMSQFTQDVEDIIDNSIGVIEKRIADYNSYSSDKDDNGIFTRVEYKEPGGDTYMISILSNPDDNGNYQRMVWGFQDGSPMLQWTITYDDDGDIVSKVVSFI